MKSGFRWFPIVLALALVLVSCAKATPTPAPATPAPAATPAPTPTPEPVKVKFSAVSAWVETQVMSRQAAGFFDLVRERSEGRIDIQYKGGPETIAAGDQLTAIKNGLIDIAVNSALYNVGVHPEMDILGLPVVGWTFDNYYDLEALVMDDLQEMHRKRSNAILLYTEPFTMYLFLVKKPVTLPEHLKGMKIRTTGGLMDMVIQSYGAIPTKIASPEIYGAFQMGTVDGGIRPSTGISAWKEGEVIKYIVETPMAFTGGGAVYMNLDAFNKLPADLQKVLQDTAQDYKVKLPAMQILEVENDWKMAREQGVQFVDIEPGAKKQWVDLPAAAALGYFKGKLGEAAAQALIDKLQKR